VNLATGAIIDPADASGSESRTPCLTAWAQQGVRLHERNHDVWVQDRADMDARRGVLFVHLDKYGPAATSASGNPAQITSGFHSSKRRSISLADRTSEAHWFSKVPVRVTPGG
jgi:hypothetical protein